MADADRSRRARRGAVRPPRAAGSRRVPPGDAPRLAAGPAVRFYSGLRATLADAAQALEAGTRAPPTGVEAVHEFHRVLRRLRSGLEVWGQLIPPLSAERLRRVDRRLREMNRRAGAVRDLDVTRALLDRHARRNPRTSRTDVRRARARLAQDRRSALRRLRASVRAYGDATALEILRLVSLDRREQLGLAASARRYREVWRSRDDRVWRAIGRVGRRPTSRRLHRLRIRLREYGFLAAHDVDPSRRRRGPSIAHRLATQQRAFGRLHDLTVAETTARRVGYEEWRIALERRRRRRTERLLGALPERPRPPRAAGSQR